MGTARDFVSNQSLDSEGILCVFQGDQRKSWGKRSAAPPKSIFESDPKIKVPHCKPVQRCSYGNFVSEFDSPENIVNMLLAFADDGSEMLSYPEVMQSITYDQVTEYLHQCFTKDRLCLSVVYPEQCRPKEVENNE